jgi:hypothetical protein
VRGAGDVELEGTFDVVVQTAQRSADGDFIAALEASGRTQFVAEGDCVAPRNIYHAMREGFDAADRLAAALGNG